jgi:hypothetical protein
LNSRLYCSYFHFMRTVTASKFRANAARIISEIAASGEAVTVTRHGKPFVRVERAQPIETPRLGILRDVTTISGDIVSPVFSDCSGMI